MILLKSTLKFAMVGIVATVAHVVVATFLVEKGALHPSAANGLAFVVANFVSYIGNTRWTFNAHMDFYVWCRFVIVSLVAWSLTVSIAFAVEKAGGHYLLGIALVVTLVPVLAFFAHRMFTYR